MTTRAKWLLGFLGFLVLVVISGEEKSQAPAPVTVTEETPRYTGDCPVYGITLAEHTSLYDNKGLRVGERKKNFVPPSTKLCITEMVQKGPGIKALKVTLGSYVGWTSDLNLEGRRIHVEPGAQEALASMQAAQQRHAGERRKQLGRLENTAHSDCKERVRRAAKYDYDFPWTGLDQLEAYETGGVVVSGRVKLMNGFGAWIPHRYHCLYKQEGGDKLSLTSFNVKPGR